MRLNRIILISELIGILATVFISVKVLILQPSCFSLFDGYTSVVPIIFTKVAELIILFKKDLESKAETFN